jgi:hypothetical protein
MRRSNRPDSLEAELQHELAPRVVAYYQAAASAETAAVARLVSGSGHKPSGKVRTAADMVKRRRRRQR